MLGILKSLNIKIVKTMAKYSKGAQKTVKSAIKRSEKGTLKSGKSDKTVTNPKQATAIGLSEFREKGAKVPVKNDKSKKAATKKTATKTSKQPLKGSVKKTAPAKTPITKKIAAKKIIPKKKEIKKEIPEYKNLPVTEESLHTPVVATPLKNELPGEEKSPVIGLNVEDPMMQIDKKLLKRITTKRDPNHNIHLSQSKSPIRPSGKKPLFNR